MPIIPINLKFEPHKQIIMKLCTMNKFYEDDMYIELYRTFHPRYKDFYLKFKTEDYINKATNEFLKNFDGLDSFGDFMYIEENGKKKIIGFLIYNIDQKTRESTLLYLLVDRKYQNKGYGSELVKKHIDHFYKNEIRISIVKCKNDKLKNFYKKFGYDEHSKYHKYFMYNHDSDYLYYIPEIALKMLDFIYKK